MPISPRRTPRSGIPHAPAPEEIDEPAFPSAESLRAESSPLFMASEPDPASEMNRVRHLPEPPMVGGMGHPSGLAEPGGQNYANLSRPVLPRMVAAVASSPGVVQWRVWRDVEGQRTYLGPISAEAGPPDFMRKFLAVMPASPNAVIKLILRGVDVNGQDVPVEVPFTIDGASAELSEVRAALVPFAAPGPAMPMGGMIDPTLTAMIREANEAANRRIESLERALQQQHAELAAERSRMADERVALASQTANSVQGVSERMLAADTRRQEEARRLDAERAKQTMETIQGANQTLIQIMQQQQQAAEATFQRRLADDEARFRRQQEEDTKRQEARDKEAERRERERESERGRAHEARMKEMELAATREREHAERMAGMNKSDSIEGLIGKATKVAGLLGVDIGGLVGGLMGGRESGGIAEAVATGIGKLSETVGDVVKENMKQQTEMMRLQMGMAQQGMIEEGGFVPSEVPGLPTTPPPAQPGGPPAVASTVIPDNDPALNEVPMPTRKAARIALRTLVKKLSGTPEATWDDEIRQAVSREFAIYHYVKAVSIRRALREAGGDETFAGRVIALADNALPSDIPRG